MTTTKFSHCTDPSIIGYIIDEMRSRHRGGYEALLQSITRQIAGYYRRSSRSSSNDLKLLVGLSGGIDSSVTTCLAAQAVGIEHVIPITMPARGDDGESILKANMVRKFLGFNDESFPYVISIEGIVREAIATINSLEYDKFRITTNLDEQSFDMKIRIGNIASRARVSILYDLAKPLNGRILGCGNRTEFVQGFAAKYGTPISFDYGVLDELYKVDVLELARLMSLPSPILNATSTTGYFLGQTHEQELGASLEEQDALAYLLFEKKVSQCTIIDKYGIKEGFVELMWRRYRESAHKRMLRQKHVIVGKMQ